MTNAEQIPTKATSLQEQSDSIIVSFGADWHDQITTAAFRAVIRKRIPKSLDFKWLYIHVNAPVGAICARAKIVKIFTPTEKEAISMAKEIQLQPPDIRAYLGGDSTIGCYQLGAFQFPKRALTTAHLSTQLVYHPPQSFLIISKSAKQIINRMAGFPNG